KGRNIASVDVEKAAQAHPGVHEVAAHGVPAAELVYEDEVKLCVVRTPGSEVTAEELAGHIMERAPYYLVPRYIEFLDELPHTPRSACAAHGMRVPRPAAAHGEAGGCARRGRRLRTARPGRGAGPQASRL